MIRGIGKDTLAKFLRANPGKFIVDMSQLASFEMCSRKYHYVYGLGLNEEKHIAASFSSIVLHPLLKLWYSSEGKSDPCDTKLGNKAPIYRVYNDYIAAIATKKPMSNKQTAAYSLDAAYVAIRDYVDRFKLDLGTYKVLSSEELYWVTLDEVPNCVFVSKPDLVLQRISDKAVVTTDYKYSLYDIGEKLIPFDRQFLGQAFAVPSKYMLKVFFQANVSERNEFKGIKITREFMPVDEELIREWKEDLVTSIEMLQISRQKDVWPKRAPQGCHPFPGITCQFIDLCSLGKSRKLMVETLPKANPLEYLGL